MESWSASIGKKRSSELLERFESILRRVLNGLLALAWQTQRNCEIILLGCNGFRDDIHYGCKSSNDTSFAH